MAKYCTHCGKQISDTAVFCKYCGTKVEIAIEQPETQVPKTPIPTSSDDEKKSGKTIAVIVVAIAVVVITAAIVALIYFAKNNDTDSAGNTETSENIQEEDTEEQAPESISDDGGIESKSVNNSRYNVGESYVVQTNLRVREGPGKEYRILERYELSPDDYIQSVDSDTTTDALMEKGSVITCLEMSGNWMRISSGWVCVEDEGEVLVE